MITPAPCAHIAAYYQLQWEANRCIAFNMLRFGYREWADGLVHDYDVNNLYRIEPMTKTVEQWQTEADALMTSMAEDFKAVQAKHMALVTPFAEALVKSDLPEGIKIGIAITLMGKMTQLQKELEG